MTQLIRIQSSSLSKGKLNYENDVKPCLNRLRKMKVVLDKMRPMEKKLRYSLDKLLALSTNNTSSMFALGDLDDLDKLEENQTDPLLFRPNPDNLIGSGDEKGGNAFSSEESDDGSDINGSNLGVL